MLEINELKQAKENQGEVQQRAKERAEAVLQKYQKVTTILQNVLRVRGISMFACVLFFIFVSPLLCYCFFRITMHFEPLCDKKSCFSGNYTGQ